jgi:hypothetical protein
MWTRPLILPTVDAGIEGPLGTKMQPHVPDDVCHAYHICILLNACPCGMLRSVAHVREIRPTTRRLHVPLTRRKVKGIIKIKSRSMSLDDIVRRISTTW